MLGLPKAVNGSELQVLANTPDSIVYNAYPNADASIYVAIETVSAVRGGISLSAERRLSGG